jgi:hypothetical protein
MYEELDSEQTERIVRKINLFNHEINLLTYIKA